MLGWVSGQFSEAPLSPSSPRSDVTVRWEMVRAKCHQLARPAGQDTSAALSRALRGSHTSFTRAACYLLENQRQKKLVLDLRAEKSRFISVPGDCVDRRYSSGNLHDKLYLSAPTQLFA
ncbi:hypothetical protein SRHO_G00281210 [Serrasalmus rhombeus]